MCLLFICCGSCAVRLFLLSPLFVNPAAKIVIFGWLQLANLAKMTIMSILMIMAILVKMMIMRMMLIKMMMIVITVMIMQTDLIVAERRMTVRVRQVMHRAQRQDRYLVAS